jgi:hypothetical protein
MTFVQKQALDYLLSLPAWMQHREARQDPEGFFRLMEIVGPDSGLDEVACLIARERTAAIQRIREAGWASLLSL